jgi:AbrB family looped-hinge helix DNA binding protein
MVYGTTTIGEKGQVVIPAEARKSLGSEPGEKLLVFGTGREMLALAKLSI